MYIGFSVLCLVKKLLLKRGGWGLPADECLENIGSLLVHTHKNPRTVPIEQHIKIRRSWISVNPSSVPSAGEQLSKLSTSWHHAFMLMIIYRAHVEK